MPVYQGRDSCMARREGWYVKRIEEPGIDTIDEAVGIAWAVIRDYRRGYGYDAKHGCKKIQMTRELFTRRVRYIYTLANKHGASERELRVIDKLVEYVLRHKRLPSRVARRSVEAILRRIIHDPRRRFRFFRGKSRS